MQNSRFLKKQAEPKNGDLDPRLEAVHDYCLAKPGTTEEYPFGPEVMVIKVCNKIFAILAWEENPLQVSVKCDPDRVPDLREAYAAIVPPRYLDKKHWNTVNCDASIDDTLLYELVDLSYELIWGSLPRKIRQEMEIRTTPRK